MTDTSTVFLYRDEERVEVLVRSRTLYAALGDAVPSAILTRFGHRRLDWELANAVRARFPEAASIILSDSNGVIDQDAVHRAALALLHTLPKVQRPSERAMLALATGRVLGRLRIEGPSPLAGRPSLAPLLDLGVTFAEPPIDQGIWYYDGKLTNRIVERYPGTYWYRLSTVHRIDEGWLGECAPQSDATVRHGTRFLEQFPRSEFAGRVTYDIAQAYETAWSLSIAPGEDESPEMPQPRGDVVSRRRAIEWYERVVLRTPSAVEAVDARRRLIQLKLNVDTGQRRFWCEHP